MNERDVEPVHPVPRYILTAIKSIILAANWMLLLFCLVLWSPITFKLYRDGVIDRRTLFLRTLPLWTILSSVTSVVLYV